MVPPPSFPSQLTSSMAASTKTMATQTKTQEMTIDQPKGEPNATSAYIIKVELLEAKNLIGANLNGTSDLYAIITCGTKKRFSSMVLGSRNPMWGEEFNFSIDALPITINYDTYYNPRLSYIFTAYTSFGFLGLVTIPNESSGHTGAVLQWYTLSSTSRQVARSLNARRTYVSMVSYQHKLAGGGVTINISLFRGLDEVFLLSTMFNESKLIFGLLLFVHFAAWPFLFLNLICTSSVRNVHQGKNENF
ncbi:hypothetical protein QVD17_19528 [Tagetes erecta]|uniref:C2 domain-containing protein n=1 Tax=Tagetes erecta TaxID=13708 RepID=A0AAD8KJR6_TARER|nr:hypothetical protein QVD17_19528 [Tagetes erecta]